EQAEESGGAKPGVRVSQAFLQNFAVRTVAVEKGPIPFEVRTVGQLGYDEGRFVSVNTKYAGWIEKARVNYVGEQVKKGDLLFEVYSPELVTTEKEFLASLEYLDALSESGKPDAIERARALVEAAKERLRWWDVSDEEINRLISTRRVTRTLRVMAPASGLIVEKMGDSLEGMKLMPGMTVFKIADLATVWAEIEVYEHQIRHVRVGQTVRLDVDAYPGRRWTGKIVYLDPVLDDKTRTLKARVAVENPDGKLRPRMYVNVKLRPAVAGGVVRVPEEVVLRTGERSVVIVQTEPGLFEPREVELGSAGGGYQEIRRGLEAGEMVVASSQFLIDSESNLREAIGKMLAGQ
ncbi:MAG: efflux RND transporter periplasmic adaptor subunit, partial [bacterium]|nr:efflux RND transporter periplasmic adaptor subunit [bacterium]